MNFEGLCAPKRVCRGGREEEEEAEGGERPVAYRHCGRQTRGSPRSSTVLWARADAHGAGAGLTRDAIHVGENIMAVRSALWTRRHASPRPRRGEIGKSRVQETLRAIRLAHVGLFW
jgi:hypothetical protein